MARSLGTVDDLRRKVPKKASSDRCGTSGGGCSSDQARNDDEDCSRNEEKEESLVWTFVRGVGAGLVETRELIGFSIFCSIVVETGRKSPIAETRVWSAVGSGQTKKACEQPRAQDRIHDALGVLNGGDSDLCKS